MYILKLRNKVSTNSTKVRVLKYFCVNNVTEKTYV